MRVVTFKIDENLLERLDVYAIKNHINRSEAIRRAIENLVKDEANNETVPRARVEKFRL